MAAYNFVIPIVQAILCFAIVILLRFCIIYLGPRIGAILVGTPMLIFPLMVMQAWLGPLPDQAQTLGSIASVTSVALGLWSMRLRVNFTSITAVLTMAAVWFAILMVIYIAKIPAIVMAAAVLLNAIIVLTKYRNQVSGPGPGRSKLSDGAVPTSIFLLMFFLSTQLVPDFVRGVLAMFPVALLATLYFVRRAADLESFRKFTTYVHGAVTATAVFVIAAHFTIAHVPIALCLFISLLISIVASIIVGSVWRGAQQGPVSAQA